MIRQTEFLLQSLKDTEQLAKSICDHARQPCVIALNGSLGTGKTQFVRYFVNALQSSSGKSQIGEVTSPTYVLLQRYPTNPTVYHFDFYRLENAAQVWDLGIDEIFEEPAWILIEWAEKFVECLPDEVLEIRLEHQKNHRTATLQTKSDSLAELVDQVSAFADP